VVGHRPKFELRQKYPTVFFIPLHSGWSVLPWHIPANMAGTCNVLKKSLVFTPRHPSGVLTRYIAAPIS
jgi:hypothetical protein